MYDALATICQKAKESGLPFWEVVCREDAQEQGITPDTSFQSMRVMYRVMCEADRSYEKDLKSASGMVGTEGEKMRLYRTGTGAVSSMGLSSIPSSGSHGWAK